MIRRRPDLVVLVVVSLATLVTIAAFVGSHVLSRDNELEIGERRVRDFGIMVGEHTARSFEAVDILLREIATDLSEYQHDWESWDATRGWDYLAKRHATSLPQLRDLIVFDRDGLQRYISTYFPTPRINVRDRPYFVALEAGQKATTFGPYIGRNSGRYTYALARRIALNFGRFGVEVDDAAGIPLLQSAMGRLARIVLACATSGFAPVDLMALLQNGATRLGMERAEVSRLGQLLDLALLRGQRPARGLAGLTALLEANVAAWQSSKAAGTDSEENRR